MLVLHGVISFQRQVEVLSVVCYEYNIKKLIVSPFWSYISGCWHGESSLFTFVVVCPQWILAQQFEKFGIEI